TVVETRAATGENAINDLSILVFDASDKLTEYVEASILSNGEIYATLKHATEQRKLLIMANVKAIVNKAKVADPNVFATGAALASIQDKLLLDAAMIIKDPTTGSNITTMPMLSDIITEAKIDEDTPLGTTTAPLQLTHRLTKISAESSVTDMQIESITLRQAPANGGRLLGNNTTPEIAERINYFGADDVATPMMPTSNQPLYMFSSSNTGSTVTKPVEMIVKARYGSDAVATYYHIRLDKKATDAATEKTLFDFNPGTHYKIIFTKVTTPGYPNVNEAIVNEYSNVDYLITDDSNMGEVLTNGQYMLNSSNSDCKIYGDFDPAFEYPIADLLTNAPAHTKIEITPV
ncbi:MAG: fimbrial protein, partial [Bacteroides sp.]